MKCFIEHLVQSCHYTNAIPQQVVLNSINTLLIFKIFLKLHPSKVLTFYDTPYTLLTSHRCRLYYRLLPIVIYHLGGIGDCLET